MSPSSILSDLRGSFFLRWSEAKTPNLTLNCKWTEERREKVHFYGKKEKKSFIPDSHCIMYNICECRKMFYNAAIKTEEKTFWGVKYGSICDSVHTYVMHKYTFLVYFGSKWEEEAAIFGFGVKWWARNDKKREAEKFFTRSRNFPLRAFLRNFKRHENSYTVHCTERG